jgi:hypothetical protein
VQLTLDTEDRTFTPHQVHGNFDDTVVLSLRGSNDRHSFTAPYAGVDVVIERGSSAEVRFVMPPRRGPDGSASYEEGVFAFYCRFHGTPTSGMHGFLVFH